MMKIESRRLWKTNKILIMKVGFLPTNIYICVMPISRRWAALKEAMKIDIDANSNDGKYRKINLQHYIA